MPSNVGFSWSIVPEGADVFVGDGAALLERRGPKDFELFAHPPDATPDNDPPLGEHVDRSQHLGGEEGGRFGRTMTAVSSLAEDVIPARKLSSASGFRYSPASPRQRHTARCRWPGIGGLDTFRKDDLVGDGENTKPIASPFCARVAMFSGVTIGPRGGRANQIPYVSPQDSRDLCPPSSIA